MGIHYRRLIGPVFACENNDDLEVQPSTQQNRVWQIHVKIEYSYGYMCLEHSQVSAESYFWECVMSFFVHKCLKTSHFFFCLAFSRLLGKTPAAEYSLFFALVYVDLIN